MNDAINQAMTGMTSGQATALGASVTGYDPETGEIVAASPPLPAIAPVMRPLASADTAEVCAALAKAQGEFEAPKRTKTNTIRLRDGSSYTFSWAPLDEIIRVIQKPFANNGLSRQQYLVNRSGMWHVRTIIWHVSGQWISSDYPIFAEQMTAHKFAGAVTTSRRHGLCLAAGLAPEDDDDNSSQPEASPAQPPQHATRATPAAAPPPSQGQDRAREAYRRMMHAIDAADNPQQLAMVYDPIVDLWGTPYEADVDLVRVISPASLELLKQRLQKRLAEVG